MRNIMRAIARLLGFQTQPLETPAQPTPTAGPASQVRTRQAGNKRSAATTKPRPQSKSATKKPSSKRKAAPSTSAAKSRKAEPKPAQTTSGKRGRPRKTPV
jgi:hypothetical protein